MTTTTRSTARGSALLLAALLAAGCTSGSAEPSRTTGIPEHYPDAIVEGLERYPDVGHVGMGDMRWDCPLEDRIEVDGHRHDRVLHTMFAQPAEGVYALECAFYRPLSATLSFSQATDDAAWDRLVAGTGAFEQVGNVQTETTVQVGDREVVVVRWEYPTNEAAGIRYVAHHLDEQTASRTSLDVSGGAEGRSEDYAEQDAANDLAAILNR